MASLDELRTRLAEATRLAAEYRAKDSELAKRLLELRKQRARDQESPNYDPNSPSNQARDAEIAALSAEKIQVLSLRDEEETKVRDLTRVINQLEAEQAAAKENNAGTGTPGTAGQGADATKPTPSPLTVAEPDVPETTTVEGIAAPPTIDTGEDPELEAEQRAKEEALANAQAESINTNQGIPGKTNITRAQATLQDTTNFQQKKDWRVRLSLSPGATYLYKDSSNTILAPLRKTDGIIFPYTPTINVTYGANYSSVAPVHSNYKIFQYENSFVDTVSITCDFTAQDTSEANYVLAVIHFLRSVTKMFYGQDENPKPGTPPPLCYLFGLGEFQFNAHPLAITNFTYNLPNDVDYIRAGALTLPAGVSRAEQADQAKPNKTNPFEAAAIRLAQNAVKSLGGGLVGQFLSELIPGGGIQSPSFGTRGFNANVPPGTVEPTYIPTRIQISISAIPIVSRYEVSNNFSVKDYASGKLLNGVKRAGGGFW
jgi:hypothetical protein